MASFIPASLPQITIKVNFLASNLVEVCIVSDADISQLDWNVETLSSTHLPLKVIHVDNFTTKVFFFTSLWTRLGLKTYFYGNYIGENLLTYLETMSSSFGTPFEEPSDAPILVAIGASAGFFAFIGAMLMSK